MRLQWLIVVGALALTGCEIGPDYKKPAMPLPAALKEAPQGWKYAQPQDANPKGAWWQVFNDPQLNEYEQRLNISNQNLKQYVAFFKEAMAEIAQAQAAYWPTISVTASDTRGKSSDTDKNNPGFNQASTLPFSDYFLEFNGTWYPDIFGVVRRNVEGFEAGAQASKAQLAYTQLTLQATLAETYFQLRMLDVLQKMLDDTVVSYQLALNLVNNQYKAGIVSKLDVAQAESQLFTAQTSALDNGVLRGQYEHAIAVFIGEFPENFSIKPRYEVPYLPQIALEIPSTLIERRPDVAQMERLMAQANAQIGVQIAAYFPILTLTGMGGMDTAFLQELFRSPSKTWSLGIALTETLFNGGLRKANVDFARANYESTVAAYKQTVLTALQNVEDNLIALRILDSEVTLQRQAVATAEEALRLTMNQYKAGTVAYSNVITAQITAYTAKQTAATIDSRRLVAAVGLIQSLGGGWDPKYLEIETSCA